MILLWSNLEDVKRDFVDEKSVDENFIRIINEMKDSWVLGKGDSLSGRTFKLSRKTILAYFLR